MEKYEEYFVSQKDLQYLLDNKAIIVPDTNFLLFAYQWRHVTVDKVKKVLKKLNEQGRLKIPEQVLYEFSKNRQMVLLEQIDSVDKEISKLQSPKKSLKEFMPVVESSSEINDAQDKSDALSIAMEQYRDSLKKIKDKIASLIIHDEYFDFIKEICKDAFLPFSEDKEIIKKEGLKRISLGIKPGTNESKKDPTGDYIIWSEIMKLNRHVIFVSNDQKKDWIYQNKAGQQVGVDQSLLKEFYIKTKGKSFLHVTPNKFITHMVPNIDKGIQDDLDKANNDLLLYSISSNQIGFGDKQGDVNRYWEIKLNKGHTTEDTKLIRDIFDECGYKRAPMVLMRNEDDDTISVIVDCSNIIMPLSHDKLFDKMEDHFDMDQVEISFSPMPLKEPYQLALY